MHFIYLKIGFKRHFQLSEVEKEKSVRGLLAGGEKLEKRFSSQSLLLEST